MISPPPLTFLSLSLLHPKMCIPDYIIICAHCLPIIFMVPLVIFLELKPTKNILVQILFAMCVLACSLVVCMAQIITFLELFPSFALDILNVPLDTL